MSAIYQTVTSYLKKPAPAPVTDDTECSTEVTDPEATNEKVIDPNEMKENDAPELSSDKKTDEIIEVQKPGSLMWRMSSGLYSATTGAVGMGIGSVKWAAGKGYDAGSVVVSTTVNTTKTVASKVPVPTWKKKAKKE